MGDATVHLSLADVTKYYGGVPALSSVNLELTGGEIHALLGENGAGKSTIAKVISGATRPDAGKLRLNGEEQIFNSPADASAVGIAMVYQETSLVTSMTVAQNLFLGNAPAINRLSRLNIEARYLLESHNFHIDPSQSVSSLGAAQKQMVEIARAVAQDARVVIFDEPTSSVTPEEKQQLFLSMERLRRAGVAIVFITHNLEEALSEADRITIMRDGELQKTTSAKEISRQEIIRLMVGRDVEYQRLGGKGPSTGQPVLEIDNITSGTILQNMSFSAYQGQVTVLAGLVGAGRSEAAMVAFGALKRRRIAGGEVRLNGQPVRFRTPRQAIRHGIAYITEDRKAYGIFDDLSIFDNIDVGHQGASQPLSLVSTQKRRQRVGEPLVERFKVRTLKPAKAKLVELSGGNQQKVVLAKSLTRLPLVAIFDEPTRGVDVGTISEIHAAIREYADRGVAVLVISSYMPEVLALADRVLVARGGRVVAEFSASEATEERVMFAAVH